jgi:hypothetical protein
MLSALQIVFFSIFPISSSFIPVQAGIQKIKHKEAQGWHNGDADMTKKDSGVKQDMRAAGTMECADKNGQLTPSFPSFSCSSSWGKRKSESAACMQEAFACRFYYFFKRI